MDDERRVTLNIRKSDVRLLCMGLYRLYIDTSESLRDNEHMKKLAQNRAYEDEIEEAVKACKREMEEISDLYKWLNDFGRGEEG